MFKRFNCAPELRESVLLAWRKGTSQNYNLYIKRWYTFCHKNKIDPISPGFNDFLAFFWSRNTEHGDSFNTFCKTRSALSILVSVQFFSEFHKLQLRLLKRALFNKNPPIPKKVPYTWDINLVLHHYDSVRENQFLPLDKLARKTAMLIMLASMRRQAEIMQLDIAHSQISSTWVKFHLQKPVKNYNASNFRTNSSLQTICISNLPDSPKTCPVHALLEYVKRTSGLRRSTQLFIINTPPYTPIKPDTLSRWLKTELTVSNVDLSVFTPHSIRSASTSWSWQSSADVHFILKQGAWTSINTFVSKYLKSIRRQHLGSPSDIVGSQAATWYKRLRAQSLKRRATATLVRNTLNRAHQVTHNVSSVMNDSFFSVASSGLMATEPMAPLESLQTLDSFVHNNPIRASTPLPSSTMAVEHLSQSSTPRKKRVNHIYARGNPESRPITCTKCLRDKSYSQFSRFHEKGRVKRVTSTRWTAPKRKGHAPHCPLAPTEKEKQKCQTVSTQDSEPASTTSPEAALFTVDNTSFSACNVSYNVVDVSVDSEAGVKIATTQAQVQQQLIDNCDVTLPYGDSRPSSPQLTTLPGQSASKSDVQGRGPRVNPSVTQVKRKGLAVALGPARPSDSQGHVLSGTLCTRGCSRQKSTVSLIPILSLPGSTQVQVWKHLAYQALLLFTQTVKDPEKFKLPTQLLPAVSRMYKELLTKAKTCTDRVPAVQGMYLQLWLRCDSRFQNLKGQIVASLPYPHQITMPAQPAFPFTKLLSLKGLPMSPALLQAVQQFHGSDTAVVQVVTPAQSAS